MVQPLWNTVWWFLKKLNIELLYEPEIPLLDTYPRKLRTRTLTNTCIPINHNNQKVLTTPSTLVHQKMNEQNVIYPYNEILFSQKKGMKFQYRPHG